MGNHLEFVAYVVANTGLVAVSSLLAGLSFLASHRTPEQPSYPLAGFGFSCICLAGLVESAYAIVIDTDSVLSSSQFLLLQAGEDLIIALGLGLLFLAITSHDPSASETTETAAPIDNADHWKAEKLFDQ